MGIYISDNFHGEFLLVLTEAEKIYPEYIFIQR